MKLKWNKPKKVLSGKYVKYAYINEDNIQDFWKIWDNKKEDIKKYGFSIDKYNNKWKLNYWSEYSDISIINKKCKDACGILGFIENKEKINEDIRKEIHLDLVKIEKSIKNLNLIKL